MLNKKYRVLLVHATVCLFLVLAGGCAPRNASGDHVDNLGYALQLTPAAPTVTTGHTLPFTATAPWGKDANWAVLPSAAGTIDGPARQLRNLIG